LLLDFEGMPFPSKIGIVGACATLQVMPSVAWDYSNTDWTTGSCADSVSGQSPIDIVLSAAAEGSAQAPPLQFDFEHQGAPDSAVTESIRENLVINNHTWELLWDVDDVATNKYGMVVDGKVYRLREFHFHSPSEHTVDGNHYDMEAQHVHVCEGTGCITQDNPDDEILVVSVFLRAGGANTYLDSFWEQYNAAPDPEASGPQVYVSDLANPYRNFMPVDKSFYSYEGSTTTPPCTQSVQWRLLEHPVEMSQEQLTAYHQSVNSLRQPATPSVVPQGVSSGWATNTKTNNRPVQQLGSRTVLHFVDSPAEAGGVETATEPTNSRFLPPLLIFLVGLGLLTAAICLALKIRKQSMKETPTQKRGVKTPSKATPKVPAQMEEQTPLMPPPLLAPNLSMVVPAQPSMVVPAQPLMQAVPQMYTTAAGPVYGQAPVFLQP
jgi:carbonic anhydrase